jgi:hypothetical protein
MRLSADDCAYIVGALDARAAEIERLRAALYSIDRQLGHDDADGDAMRLAVRLDLLVYGNATCVRAVAADHHTSIDHDGTEPDKLRARREAVVLCAAAVGERMRKGGA